MLTVLTQELTTTVARRFRASIDAVGNSRLLSKLDKFRTDMSTSGGHLPDQTATYSQTETVPAVFEWQLPKDTLLGTRTVSTILSFYDTAGEDLSNIDIAREQHYLARMGGEGSFTGDAWANAHEAYEGNDLSLAWTNGDTRDHAAGLLGTYAGDRQISPGGFLLACA